MRQLLIEASGGICKGAVGHKSKDLRARQNGNTAEVIAYADKSHFITGRRVHHEITQITKKLKMVDFFWKIA